MHCLACSLIPCHPSRLPLIPSRHRLGLQITLLPPEVSCTSYVGSARHAPGPAYPVHVHYWHVLTWKVTVATGIHLAWSLPMPFLAMAFSFSS